MCRDALDPRQQFNSIGIFFRWKIDNVAVMNSHVSSKITGKLSDNLCKSDFFLHN